MTTKFYVTANFQQVSIIGDFVSSLLKKINEEISSDSDIDSIQKIINAHCSERIQKTLSIYICENGFEEECLREYLDQTDNKIIKGTFAYLGEYYSNYQSAAKAHFEYIENHPENESDEHYIEFHSDWFSKQLPIVKNARFTLTKDSEIFTIIEKKENERKKILGKYNSNATGNLDYIKTINNAANAIGEDGKVLSECNFDVFSIGLCFDDFEIQCGCKMAARLTKSARTKLVEWLLANHKQGENFTEENLLYWEVSAVDSQNNNDLKGGHIEIRSFDSLSGHTQTVEFSANEYECVEGDNDD